MNLSASSLSLIALLCAFIAFGSALVAVFAVKRAAPLRSMAQKLRSLESSFGSLNTDVSEIWALLRRLDARDRMRKIRAGETNQTGDLLQSSTTSSKAPNPHTHPNEWKAWMRHHKPPSAKGHN